MSDRFALRNAFRNAGATVRPIVSFKFSTTGTSQSVLQYLLTREAYHLLLSEVLLRYEGHLLLGPCYQRGPGCSSPSACLSSPSRLSSSSSLLPPSLPVDPWPPHGSQDARNSSNVGIDLPCISAVMGTLASPWSSGAPLTTYQLLWP